MDNSESNFQKKTSQRDGWSDVEKQFFLECYNLNKDEVGKNKRFSSKKKLFSWIAVELADSIGSSKTDEQVSSRYYTLTRMQKPKRVSIIDLSDATIINTSEASFININEEQSTEEPLIREMNTFINESSAADMIGTPNEASAVSVSSAFNIIETVNEASSDENGYMLTDVNTTSNIASAVNTSAQMIETVNETPTERNRSMTAMSADVNATNVQSVNKETTSIGLLSTFRRNYRSFSRLGEPSRIQNSLNVGIAAVYNSSPTNGISSCNNGSFSGAGIASTFASTNCPMAGAVSARVSSATGTSCTDSVSLGRLTQPSNCSQNPSTSSCQGFSSRTTLALRNDTASLASNIEDWTDDETKWLLDQYGYYMDEVGPKKLFRNKNDLWGQLAKVMSEVFGKERTVEQLSKRVATIINQKKAATDRNRKSGATRVNVAYDEEISRIAAMDDSIEPEVLRDANSVYYKHKKVGEPENKKSDKKPRWDKPTKKGICNSITDIMLSIQQRRTDSEKAKEEREKEKDERRKQMHEAMMEMFRSIRRPEN